MTRGVVFAPGEFYHLYNRGTDKRQIFSCLADYKRFILLLLLCNQKRPVIVKIQGRTLEEATQSRIGDPLVDIVSYCLMPNHFHIIAREIDSGGISKFIQKVITGYTIYFNQRYERSGVLFQGKFKAKHIHDDRYLSYLISYVHPNPIKLLEPRWKTEGISDLNDAEEYLESYRYSSYKDYRGQTRPESMIVNMSALPEYFTSPKDFKTHVTQWLSYDTR